MVARVLVGSILAAAAFFLWGAFFWMGLPFAKMTMPRAPGGEKIAQVLAENLPASGRYAWPGVEEKPDEAGQAAAWAAFEAEHRAGPVFIISYTKDGVEPMSPAVFITGYLQNLVLSLAAAMVLAIAGPALCCYGMRVFVVVLMGLFGAVMIDLAEPIWMHQPWPYQLVMLGYHLSAALIVGLVLGAIVRPRRCEATAATK